MRPMILVTSEEGHDPHSHAANFVLSRNYSECVLKSGGLPLMPMDIRTAKEYAELADALLLTGGPNIHRGRYRKYYTDFKEMEDLCSTRDDFEFTLFNLFFRSGKPILGIGRGMQVINAALGGTLLFGLHNEHPDQGEHPVSLVKGTKLREALGDEITVNSFHLQAVDTLGSGLRVSARAKDGVVEAIEHESAPVYGIQWHPELGPQEERDPSVFNFLIKLC